MTKYFATCYCRLHFSFFSCQTTGANTNVSPVNVFRSVTVAITYELVLCIPQVNAQAKYVAQR